MTGTFGKALGGASGGFTAARKEIVELLRQPLASLSVLQHPVAVAGGSLKAIELISASTVLRDKLEANTLRFRSQMQELGFTVLGGGHPISPVLLGDAMLAQNLFPPCSKKVFWPWDFSVLVVPHGKARIRTQISAADEPHHIDAAVQASPRLGASSG